VYITPGELEIFERSKEKRNKDSPGEGCNQSDALGCILVLQ
jgi:hypothetical protein